jgi:phosphoadenosine phosphosulfate reductase
MCPATDIAELRISREVSDRYPRWQQYLAEYASSKGKPKVWVEKDLWRWKRLPNSVVDELSPSDREQLRTAPNVVDASPLEFRSTSGCNPCVEGLSMEGIFSKPLPMDRVANLLNILGEVITSPDGNIAEVRSVTVFGEGPIMIKASDERELKKKAANLREVVMRAVECAGCGICVGRCHFGALGLDGQVWIDAGKCTHCGACLGPCPAVRFKENDLDI